MSQFGFDISADDEPIEIIEDEVPETAPSMVKLGDIWQLGEHRLICGDSTDVAVIDRLMDGVKADMVFTDPPYGVAYQGGMKIENGKIESNGKKQIKNDALDYENLVYMEVMEKPLLGMAQLTRKQCGIWTRKRNAIYIQP